MLDLTWWQVVALVGIGLVAGAGGRLLGAWLHHVLCRRMLVARGGVDERILVRLGAPFEVAGVALVWQVLIGFFALPASVLSFCRNLGHVGLLLAMGWAAMRMLDARIDHASSRSRSAGDQRLAQVMLPLARRIAKGAIGVLVALMVLSRMGYAIGPLLVVLAICGAAFAFAAHRPLENVLAAYAIIGDHGIRETDVITLDFGVTGTVEHIGLYSTRLRTREGTYVIVPNRKLADAHIRRAVHRTTTLQLGAVAAPSSHHSRTAGGLS